MMLTRFTKVIASLSFFACTSLSAAPLVVDVAGIQSVGEVDDPGNTVRNFNVGANAKITSVAFDVSISAFLHSFLSEIGVVFEASDLSGSVSLFPGSDDNFSGTGAYAGAFDLVALDLAFNVGSDGILRLEFFDDFDDVAGADGQWNFGTITFGIEPADADVPEPSTTLLMGAGLAMLGYAGRRRTNFRYRAGRPRATI